MLFLLILGSLLFVNVLLFVFSVNKPEKKSIQKNVIAQKDGDYATITIERKYNTPTPLILQTVLDKENITTHSPLTPTETPSLIVAE